MPAAEIKMSLREKEFVAIIASNLWSKTARIYEEINVRDVVRIAKMIIEESGK